MGMVKWSGEGFKLLGKLLTNEIVEDWLQSQGKELVKRSLEGMAAKWFLGNARARRQARKAVLAEVNSSKPLRMALNDSLDKLPSVIRGLALTIEEKHIDVLTKSDTFTRLVVVPRALVVNDFTLILLKDLVEAAELKRFHALSDHFLRRQATQAEEALSDKLARDGAWAVVDASGMIVGADAHFDWHLKNIPGHYYYGYSDRYSTDLNKRSERKELLAELAPWLEKKMVELGRLTIAEIDEAARHFFKQQQGKQ